MNGLKQFATQLTTYLLLWLAAGYAFAFEGFEPIGNNLNEEILRVNIGSNEPLELQTTLFKPPGQGPFPVLIINHGKSEGSAKTQARARYYTVAREFVRRGYAVILPMRRGFAGSDGNYQSGGCNLLASAMLQAQDIAGIMKWITQQPLLNSKQVMMFGQSYGGLTALGYAAQPQIPVKLIVNFAGGLRVVSANRPCDWQTALQDAMTALGSRGKIPSLWFYGENDSYFDATLSRQLFENYKKGGGPAEFIQYPAYKQDAHKMFGDPEGWPIWLPKTLETMKALGLPTEVRYVTGTLEVPAPSAFADLTDANALPFVRDNGRTGYKTFLRNNPPRAFAISASGSWAWSAGGDESASEALKNCKKNSVLPCYLYAVDEAVVWDPSVLRTLND